MHTTRKLLTCLFVLALAAGLGSVALAAGPDADLAPPVDAPQIDGEEEPAPPAAEPEAPAADEEGAEADEPFLDLETPEPELKCLTGSCSADWQCERWVGPGSWCQKEPGHGCGWCVQF